MLLRGDLNKIMDDVNRVLAGAFKRIEALEDKLQALETPGMTGVAAVEPSRRRGRPPGSKNKSKEL